jgi:hypothetical protein
VEPLTDAAIRACFVNATRGDVRRINLPDLDDVAWADLDFLGWVDPKAPQRAYLVVVGDSGPVGVQMRRNAAAGAARTKMCSLCLTTHPGTGVALMVAPRAGRAGREGNTTGLDICADLRCSAYVRGLVPLPGISRVHETTPVADKVARLRRNLDTFVRRVTGTVAA